jgi:hypothetical protein
MEGNFEQQYIGKSTIEEWASFSWNMNFCEEGDNVTYNKVCIFSSE